MSSNETSRKTTKKTTVLIVAAGSGARFGRERPKQYQLLGGVPMLRRTVLAFLGHPHIGAVQVVIQPEHRPFYDEAVRGLTLPSPVSGGATRQESVHCGLQALAADTPEYVLIHDAARPFVSAHLISAVIEELAEHSAIIPALPVADTLKRVEGERVAGTVERSGLCRVQTPQGFHFPLILAAHVRFAGDTLTDDAALIEKQGGTVATITGEEMNFKITTAEDAARAEMALKPAHSAQEDSGGAQRRLAALSGAGCAPLERQNQETRTGQGFDVHRLVDHPSGVAQVIRLCGVDVPFHQRLEGHSDADVGIHALVDALLGAIAEGDIGQHFPPGDARWKGADSADFLGHAAALVRQKGARIVNVDVTLIGERPKISPHREAMREALAGLLGLPISRVSVKATTTEGLGFTGRGEGLAAQAVASVHYPCEAS